MNSQKELEQNPISNVQWVERDSLKANWWNPNRMAPPEMKLLKTSLLENGWYFPILVNSEMMIMDGFHRWHVAGDKEVNAKTGGLVPIVVVPGLSVSDSMILTVRANRAKGTHAVLEMADIVENLFKEGLKMEEIMVRLSMEDEEVIRLASKKGLTVKALEKTGQEFAKAWKPDVNR